MFKIVFEAFMRAKTDCFIEWIQASSKNNYLVNFLDSKNFPKPFEQTRQQIT